MITLENFIGGKMCPPQAKGYLDNYEPAKGQIYGQLPDSDASDVEAAIAAAQKAAPAWGKLSTQERSRYLMKVSERIQERLEELAQAESRDNGKPVKLARSVDIPRALDNFAFFATAILHQEDAFHAMGERGFNYTLRQPLGTVACISPWNLPLYLFTWKICPALAAGNAVVAKPSEVSPYTAYLLGEICQEVGFPAGVLNIVHGRGSKVGEALVKHTAIKAISFTGGTQTGARIAELAAPQFKKLSLELGGKNPNLIFADCDLERAISVSARASFANQGQICLCGSRILIEASIYEEFKKGFLEKVAQLTVGPPHQEEVQMGALVSAAHRDKVLQYIDLARQEGGTVLCGGHALPQPAPYDQGYYLAPTVIEDLPQACRTNSEEIFGPVVTLQPFSSEEEALAKANATQYGLAATVFTQDVNRAHRVAAHLQSGIVWINDWLVRDLRTPFGGMKNSGVGREGGFEALHFFTEAKNVCLTVS